MAFLHINFIIFLLVCFISLSDGRLYKPKVPIVCNINQHCPVEFPCCSPYGECGRGPICIGGCNPFFSFSPRHCIPHKLQSEPVTRLGAQMRIMEYFKYLITIDQNIAKEQFANTDFIYSGHILPNRDGDLWLTMPRKTSGSLVATPWEFLHGNVQIKMKIAKGIGVITAIVLISQVGDEIDLEFIGGETTWAQSNFFSQGQLDYTRMMRHPLPGDASEIYNTFGIDWTQDRMQWFINGQLIRTVYKLDTWDNQLKRYKYPSSPSRLEIAVWPGGDETNNPGTISWAGGKIDWEKDPTVVKDGFFHAQVNSIHIVPAQRQQICPNLFYRYSTPNKWENICSTIFYHSGTNELSSPMP